MFPVSSLRESSCQLLTEFLFQWGRAHSTCSLSNENASFANNSLKSILNRWVFFANVQIRQMNSAYAMPRNELCTVSKNINTTFLSKLSFKELKWHRWHSFLHPSYPLLTRSLKELHFSMIKTKSIVKNVKSGNKGYYTLYKKLLTSAVALFSTTTA